MVPYVGLEPTTSRLEGECAIQLRQWGKVIYRSTIPQQIYYDIRFNEQILRPGIDPGPLAWKASMQPLTLTEQFFSSMGTNYYFIFKYLFCNGITTTRNP